MASAIRIVDLIKDFSIGIRGLKLRAVDQLSLEVEANKVVGLLGPNGCGKSTTMKIIVGLLKATRGQCEVFGKPCASTEARKSIGYMPEAPYFYRYLTGEELLRFYAKICSTRNPDERIKEVISMVDMSHAGKRRVGTYSKGMLQRIGLAQAMIHNPELLILDEPTAGVDPAGTVEISKIIKRLKEGGKTVLLCSHLLSEVEGVCDEIAILNKGKLQACGPVNELLELDTQHNLSISGLSDEKKNRLEQFLKDEGIETSGLQKSRKSLTNFFMEKTNEKDD